jgi:hypothetical protein
MANYDWYVSESEKNFQPTRDAVQKQIDAISGQQSAALGDLQKSYQLQTDNLNKQRVTASNNASMSSAMRGGAFGGQANIQNEKFYNDTFVPAITQANNALQSDTRATNEAYTNRRGSLEQTLASLVDEQRRYAMEQYQKELDRESSERAARAAAAAQAASLAPYLNQKNPWQMTPNGSGGWNFHYNDTPITAYQYAQGTGLPMEEVLSTIGSDAARQILNMYNGKGGVVYSGNNGGLQSAIKALGLNQVKLGVPF